MKRRVMRQLQSALATLLSLAGLAVAAVPALAQTPEQYAAWSLALDPEAGAWDKDGGPNCSNVAYRRTIPEKREDAAYALPVECPDLQQLAPGDAGHVGTYTVAYEGSGTLNLSFRGRATGTLFSGDHPVRLIIEDDRGNTYDYNDKYQAVPGLQTGDTLTFTVRYEWSSAASNLYQGDRGTIHLTLLARGTGRPPGGGDDGGGGDGGGDNGGGGGSPGGGGGGGGDTPPRQPPTTQPETPAPVASGRVIVRVLGDPWGDGDLAPLPGASVTLADFTGETDATGQVIFDGLPFGRYTAMATAAHPKSGENPLTGTGTAEITADEPEGYITILLTWPPAPRTPPAEPVTSSDRAQTGSLTVRVLDASPRNAGGARPLAGALVHVADRAGYTGDNGELRLEGLPLGSYTAYAEAVDPTDPEGERRTGTASAKLLPEAPDQVVTITLAWHDPPEEVDLTPGALVGRVCAPREGGARIWATNDAGEMAATVVAATGRLGVWLDYELTGLASGAWTLTLQNPGDPAVSQQVTVQPGQAIAVPDFTLACTGEGSSVPPQAGYYITGVVLLLAGWQLRRMGRRLRA